MDTNLTSTWPNVANEIDNFGNMVAEAEKLCERRSTRALPLVKDIEVKAQISGLPVQKDLAAYIHAYYDCFVANEYDRAIRNMELVMRNIEPEDLNAIGHKLWMVMGNACHMKGDTCAAQEHYIKGLQHLQSAADVTIEQQKFTAAFCYNLANILLGDELKEEAEDYITRAIDIYTVLQKKFQLSKCYLCYGKILESRGQYSQAAEMLNRALKLDEETGDRYNMALSKANLGIVMIRQGMAKKATMYLLPALEFYYTSRMPLEAAMAETGIGKAYLETGEITAALEYLDKAEGKTTSLENSKLLAEICKLKAAAFKKLKNFEAALAYTEKHIQGIQQYYNREKNEAIMRLRKAFELDLKEKEAETLKRMNAEIKKYALQLEVSNNELQSFAHIASHDMREPLRVISSYIYLLRKSAGAKLNSDELELMNFVEDGAVRLNKLVHNILQMTKINVDVIEQKVKLQSVMEEVKLNLFSLMKKKNAVLNYGTMPVIMADKIQMVQLFQNLVANAVNYNKRERPEINITTQITDELLEIRVADNGIGIPQSARTEIFEAFKRLYKTEAPGMGMGLNICKRIVERMKGSIDIQDNPGGGTIFIVKLNASVIQR